MSRRRWIYVIGFGDYVKIGITDDVDKRIRSLQTACPEVLTVYNVLEGDMALERALHREFEQYHLRGEWFSNCQRLKAWIRRGCPISHA